MTQELREVLATPTQTATPGVWRLKLIEADTQGSSGYYPGETLRRDGPAAFPKGTHIYYDHPTSVEEQQRPERSVRDLAGVLIEEARFEQPSDDTPGLFAHAQFRPSDREEIEFLASHTGMSVRAMGVVEESDEGNVVRQITHGLSVDVVTAAGAGGRLVSMAESANSSQQGIFSLNETDKQGMQQLYNAVTELNSTISALREEANSRKQTQQSQQVQQQQESAAGVSLSQIMRKLDESDLPSVSRQRLAVNYTSEEELDQAIQAEQSLVNEVKQSVGDTGSQQQGQFAGQQQSSQTSAPVTPGKIEETSTKNLDDILSEIGLV